MPKLHKHQQDGTFYTRSGQSTYQISHHYVKMHNIKVGKFLPSDWKNYAYTKGDSCNYAPENISSCIFKTCCSQCGKYVFYYENDNGSKVFFDDIGKPWPKHPCMVPKDIYAHHLEEVELDDDDFAQIQKHFNSLFSKKRYMCLNCGEIFESQVDLEQHKVEVHTKEFKCKYCNKVFYDYNQFSSHIIVEHEKYKCKYCSKRFTGKKKLLSHIHSIHGKHKCTYCDKRFFSEEQMLNHIEIAHGEYKCPYCKKRFFNKIDLKDHMLKVHPEYRCMNCGEPFANKTQLEQHKKCTSYYRKRVRIPYS